MADERRPITLGDIFNEQAFKSLGSSLAQVIGKTLWQAIMSVNYQAIIRHLYVNATMTASLEGLTEPEQRQLKRKLEKSLNGKKGPGQPVTPQTIQEYHELAKTTSLSDRKIKQRLGTDTRTYYQYCEKYTGEQPFIMKERAKFIKNKNWPHSDGAK